MSITMRDTGSFIKKIFSTLMLLIVLSLVSGCSFLGVNKPANLPIKAEKLAKEGKQEQAIQVYRQHIALRVTDPQRPEWENPYFYELLIGDIQLEQDKLPEALGSYISAKDKNVDSSLISDRLRKIAGWYEEHSMFKEAINLLEANRSVDPLLFDVVLDRLAKKLVENEDLIAGESPAQ